MHDLTPAEYLEYRHLWCDILANEIKLDFGHWQALPPSIMGSGHVLTNGNPLLMFYNSHLRRAIRIIMAKGRQFVIYFNDCGLFGGECDELVLHLGTDDAACPRAHNLLRQWADPSSSRAALAPSVWEEFGRAWPSFPPDE